MRRDWFEICQPKPLEIALLPELVVDLRQPTPQIGPPRTMAGSHGGDLSSEPGGAGGAAT